MAPLWRSRFSFGSALLFLFLGLLAAALFVPLGGILHAAGHGLAASMTGCTWIGVSVPMFHHGQALVNYSNLSFGGRRIALWYWLGGFLMLAVVMVFLYSFPFPQTFMGQLIPRLAGLHLMVTAGLLPLVQTLDDGDLRLVSDILRIPVLVPAVVVGGILAAGMVLSLFLLVRLPGGSMAMTGAQKAFFILVIWTIPLALYIMLGWLSGQMDPVAATAVAAAGLLPLFAAPFIAPDALLHPRPSWAATMITLGTAATILCGLLAVGLDAHSPDPKGFLWGETNLYHNIPTSMLIRRWNQ